ncbi:MAG: hypothetical protein HYV29_00955 [Ignavibacteriales bacterium]|nr:hypothetical protein [Ignavibacteriales bacterium]
MKTLQRIFIFIFLGILSVSAQVLNDAKVLSQGRLNIGIAPVSTGGNFGLYTDLGYGIARGMDLDVIIGFLQGGTYVGANLEFPLSYQPNISLAVGGHSVGGTAGIDGTFNLSFQVGNSVGIYGGIDVDVNFNNGTTTLPAWAFIAMNARIRSNIELFIEVDPALSDDASSIFGGGLKIYL